MKKIKLVFLVHFLFVSLFHTVNSSEKFVISEENPVFKVPLKVEIGDNYAKDLSENLYKECYFTKKTSITEIEKIVKKLAKDSLEKQANINMLDSDLKVEVEIKTDIVNQNKDISLEEFVNQIENQNNNISIESAVDVFPRNYDGIIRITTHDQRNHFAGYIFNGSKEIFEQRKQPSFVVYSKLEVVDHEKFNRLQESDIAKLNFKDYTYEYEKEKLAGVSLEDDDFPFLDANFKKYDIHEEDVSLVVSQNANIQDKAYLAIGFMALDAYHDIIPVTWDQWRQEKCRKIDKILAEKQQEEEDLVLDQWGNKINNEGVINILNEKKDRLKMNHPTKEDRNEWTEKLNKNLKWIKTEAKKNDKKIYQNLEELLQNNVDSIYIKREDAWYMLGRENEFVKKSSDNNNDNENDNENFIPPPPDDVVGDTSWGKVGGVLLTITVGIGGVYYCFFYKKQPNRRRFRRRR